MTDNWFVTTTAFLWLAGGIQYLYQGNWRMVVVSVCYGAATLALVGAK